MATTRSAGRTGKTTVIKKQGCAALTAVLVLGAASAHASMVHVDMTTPNPNYTALFGGLSFDVNTAATTNTISTGSCGGGTTSGVYESAQFTGGVSNASLVWSGVDYSLQSASFFLEEDSQSCGFYLDMSLKFNNGTVFTTSDQLASVNPFLASNFTPSQVLADSLIGGYNTSELTAPFLAVGGQDTGLTAFKSTATSVPEPGTLALFAAGLAGLAMSRRRLKA